MAYDIVTVGGGLGGSALAIAMAREGRRVLVLESETRFRDRVRGEQLASWGVAEAKELGIFDLLVTTCANEESRWNGYFAGVQVQDRDLIETTPQRLPNLTFFHPEMQETLLNEAEASGVEVRRGARVRGVEAGERPAVLVEHDGRQQRVEARLVVGADGRNSMVRKWAGFEVRRDPEVLQIGGVIMDNCPLPAEAAHLFFNPPLGIASPVFPQGKSRARLYLVTRVEHGPGHSGDRDLPAFLEACGRAGVDGAVLSEGRYSGPLATFSGAAVWVERPYRAGVALVGDAAGHSDPAWGQGLSLTLRDVRVLRDSLLAGDDWEAAGDAYARERSAYFATLNRVEQWFSRFFYDVGTEADALRARAIPHFNEEPERIPDHFQSGPDAGPADEAARKRFFAED